MILFVAPYPEPDEKEGMAQRIINIDRHFEHEERAYLEITFDNDSAWYTPKSSKLNLFRLNLKKPDQYRVMLDLIIRAKFIYVHSLYNTKYILDFYKTKKIITDLHGAVPEEIAYDNQPFFHEYYEAVEKYVLENSLAIINVSESMTEHFKKKYPDSKAKMLVIPTLEKGTQPVLERQFFRNKRQLDVIYSGGAQKWQNADMMLDAIHKASGHYQFRILSPDTKIFQKQINRLGIQNRVELKAIPKSEVGQYYLKSDLGFVLRDDSVLNVISCPTKLVEYLCYGIIPIVLNPNIGDFEALGYQYILLQDFISGNIPSFDDLEIMREKNYVVVNKIKDTYEQSVSSLMTLTGSILKNEKDRSVEEIRQRFHSYFTHLQSEKKLSKAFKIAPIKPQGNLEFYLDQLTQDKWFVEFKGWAYIKGALSQKVCKISLILVTHERWYRLETNLLKRPDVADEEGLSYDEIGFYVTFRVADIEEGVYQVGLLLSNGKATVFHITDERILISKDPLNQASKCPPFLKTQLFVDTGAGFKEKQSITNEILLNRKEVVFYVGTFKRIKGLRFDPLDQPVMIKLNEIFCVHLNGKKSKIKEFKGNYFVRGENELVFEGDDPYIIFDVPSGSDIEKVVLKLKYVGIGADLYETILENKNSELIKRYQEILKKEEVIQSHDQLLRVQEKDIAVLQKRISTLEEQLKNIFNSRGWKVLLKYYRLRDKLLPNGSYQRKIAKQSLKIIRNLIHSNFSDALRHPPQNPG